MPHNITAMVTRWFALLTALVVFMFSVSLVASESPAPKVKPDRWQYIFQLDNDLFAGSDRNYTSGARLAAVRELPSETQFSRLLDRALLRLSGGGGSGSLLPGRLRDRSDLRFATGSGITQLMYTPDDPEAPAAPDGQRPYAGWLGLEFSLHAKSHEQVSGATLSLGTTGSRSLAEESQDWVHENISNSPEYQGWGSQVPGEFTVNLHFDHKRRIETLDKKALGSLQFDGYYEWGAAIGNFRTAAYGGALVRAGHNLPASHSTPRVQLGSYGHELFRSPAKAESEFSSLVFLGARYTAVGFDITLDGPLFRDFDTGVESRPFVNEFITGLAVRYGFMHFAYTHTFRSREFYGQNASQEFGSIMFRLELRTK